MTSILVLASASPRRTEILDLMGLEHEVVKSTVDESKIVADHPRTFALRAAYAKATDVAAKLPEGRWVLAADTVVTRNMLLFGKPTSTEHAKWMLRQLSGGAHDVITAVALTQSGKPTTHLRADRTSVIFRDLSDPEIEAYIASGEPMDKAGAYGIQGAGASLISAIDGDYFNVVGLPAHIVLDLFAEAGLESGAVLPEPPGRWN